jgi:hypothetical protein
LRPFVAPTDAAKRWGRVADQSPGPTSRGAPPAESKVTSMKFIDGLPMNPATKRFDGVS